MFKSFSFRGQFAVYLQETLQEIGVGWRRQETADTDTLEQNGQTLEWKLKRLKNIRQTEKCLSCNALKKTKNTPTTQFTFKYFYRCMQTSH